MKPTIHLTSTRARTGRTWSVWPWGANGVQGHVPFLTPFATDVEAANSGQIDTAEYERRCRREFNRYGTRLEPGRLLARPNGQEPTEFVTVTPGDTLVCICARLGGRAVCHLPWVAAALTEAGWQVIFEGREWP